jgi:hypothetical protein
MGEQKDERRVDSLSPIAIEKDVINTELAAMHKGNRFRIIGFALVLVIAVGGSVALLRGIDAKGDYVEAGKALNGIKKTEFDRFWGCVLSGVDLREIKSNDALIARIRERSRANGILFARQIRDRCLDILISAETRLEPSLFPLDLRDSVKEMRKGATETREAWNAYVSYLTVTSPIDEDAASGYETNIAKGWYSFLKAHGDLNNYLRGKLQ